MSTRPRIEFVDTNVLVYAYDTTAAEKHRRASALVAELWRSRQGCLSVQVLQEFYITGQRKLPGVNLVALREIVADFALWHVHAPQAADVLSAIDRHRRYQISFWDAMILQSAGRLGCLVVWSEDLNAGQRYHDVQVVDPFAQRFLRGHRTSGNDSRHWGTSPITTVWNATLPQPVVPDDEVPGALKRRGLRGDEG